MEDYLDAFESKSGKPVFCWMGDDFSSRHPDSYGSCLNYGEFIEAFKESKFTKEQWLDSVEYWENNNGCGVPLKLIASFLRRHFADSN